MILFLLFFLIIFCICIIFLQKNANKSPEIKGGKGDIVDIYKNIYNTYKLKLNEKIEYGGLVVGNDILENAIWDGSNINWSEDDIIRYQYNNTKLWHTHPIREYGSEPPSGLDISTLLLINDKFPGIKEGIIVEKRGIWRYLIHPNKQNQITDAALNYISYITNAWATCLTLQNYADYYDDWEINAYGLKYLNNSSDKYIKIMNKVLKNIVIVVFLPQRES